METLLMFLITFIPQIIICAGIINSVELLKDIRDELEERNDRQW